MYRYFCSVSDRPVILFDGVCNFCNSVVTFTIRQDKQRLFRFAALQSPVGQQLLGRYGLPTHSFDSFILIEKDKAYKSSTAALKLYGKLPWYWKWTQVFWIVPRFLRDAVYNTIARNRYKWFGRQDQCMVPTPELRSRFL